MKDPDTMSLAELRLEVARQLGWTESLAPDNLAAYPGDIWWIRDGKRSYRTPNYSQDISAAWECVVKACLSVVPYKDGHWHAADGKIIARGATAPEAICRAFLKTVNHE